ncbi:MAG: hypothetical protein ABF542_13295 [Gluconobacter sp.]
MTQNTEQNVRAAREQDGQVQEMHADMVKAVCGRRSDYPEDVFRAYLKRHIVQAEARGAEEQRRKDAEGHGRPVYQWRLTPDDNWVTAVDATELEQVRNGYPASETRTLFTRPANVAALEALVASLKEAEQLARADAEASKANAGWNFLTENVSSDPELPSCRLSTLFQEGDELSRFQRAAQEFGIEIRLVTDDREDEDCDKELSAEILSKFDSCQFLIRDGWSFVDVWENDDGGIIRLFARAALTREGGV